MVCYETGEIVSYLVRVMDSRLLVLMIYYMLLIWSCRETLGRELDRIQLGKKGRELRYKNERRLGEELGCVLGSVDGVVKR